MDGGSPFDGAFSGAFCFLMRMGGGCFGGSGGVNRSTYLFGVCRATSTLTVKVLTSLPFLAADPVRSPMCLIEARWPASLRAS